MLDLLDRTIPEQLISRGDCRRIAAIASRCLRSSAYHKRNLRIIVKLLLMALEDEFTEDNRATLIALLHEAVDGAAAELPDS